MVKVSEAEKTNWAKINGDSHGAQHSENFTVKDHTISTFLIIPPPSHEGFSAKQRQTVYLSK